MAIIKGDVTRIELTDKYEKKSLDRLPPLKEWYGNRFRKQIIRVRIPR